MYHISSKERCGVYDKIQLLDAAFNRGWPLSESGVEQIVNICTL